MVFLWFSHVFLWFSYGFPTFSYGFPMVFPYFPMVFLGFPYGPDGTIGSCETCPLMASTHPWSLSEGTATISSRPLRIRSVCDWGYLNIAHMCI